MNRPTHCIGLRKAERTCENRLVSKFHQAELNLNEFGSTQIMLSLTPVTHTLDLGLGW